MTDNSRAFETSFPATEMKLPEILAWIHENLQHSALSPKEAMQFELALEEAVVNIVLHGYADHSGQIEIQTIHASDRVSFTLIDAGSPYDPVNAPIKEEVPFEEMVEGGLGVKFMRLYCDQLHYERAGQHNVLVLVKMVTSSSQ